MAIKVKRIYDPAEPSDGTRVLADRLWPRGVTKEKAHIDVWAKDLTPSDELRKWVHADKETRWKEFEKKYAQQLKANKKAITEIMGSVKHPFTLVTAVKEIEHSHIPTLVAFLSKL